MLQFSRLVIATLTILIATEANQIVHVSFLTNRDERSVFEATRYAYYLLLFAIYAFDTCGGLKELLGVLPRDLARFDVDSCLEVSTCTPAIKSVLRVNCKAVTSP